MKSWLAVYWWPCAALVSGALAQLAFDGLSLHRRDERWRTSGFAAALAGILAAAVLNPPVTAETAFFGRGMLVWDAISWMTVSVAVVTAAFVVLLASGTASLKDDRIAPFYGLLLFSTVGLFFLGTANDMAMLFLGIELVSIPLFVLTGYTAWRQASVEAAAKFFLVAVFSSGVLLYGISLYYGLFGTLSLAPLQNGASISSVPPAVLGAAMVLVLVAFGYKIGLVPFHLWVPDAFTGAPTPVGAYLSVAPKIAGLIVLARVFQAPMQNGVAALAPTVALIAAATIFVGTLLGLRQTRVLRLLAYSSIAHMGFMLVGVLAGGPFGQAATYFYAAAYLFTNIGAFTIVTIVVNRSGDSELRAFNGLSRRAPLLAFVFSLFLFSLAGLPPLAGFVAKFNVFSAAYNAGWAPVVVWAAFNAVLSVAYYFRIVRAMYLEPAEADAPRFQLSVTERTLLGVTSFFTVFLGVSPQSLLDFLAGLVSR